MPALGAVGGGGMTLALSELPALLLALAVTEGGGGTTSEGPKIFPMRLLTNDPPPDCVGGGGTTVRAGSGVLPLANLRMSRETSAEGGGAITDGAGKLSFGLRTESRSGAETGGGTTAALAICTGDRE